MTPALWCRTIMSSMCDTKIIGELDITDMNRRYLQWGQLNVEIMGRGFAWFDAASFIAILQKRQSLQVACPEEIAFQQGWINAEQLPALAMTPVPWYLGSTYSMATTWSSSCTARINEKRAPVFLPIMCTIQSAMALSSSMRTSAPSVLKRSTRHPRATMR